MKIRIADVPWLMGAVVLAAAMIALAADNARAQGPGMDAAGPDASQRPFMPLSAIDPTAFRARRQIYRLEAASQYRNACFDPCDCAMDLRSPLSGTMELQLLSVRECQRDYLVSDVNFRTRIGGTEVPIRGRGTYTWYCSLGPLTVLAHRLSLDLRVGINGTVQRFDSEQIAGASDGTFPPINIVIDKNNQVCTDEVLRIRARPVAASALRNYRLESTSTYQKGCLPPCLCPLLPEVPVTGTFTLVPLPSRTDTPAIREWAVVRVRWSFRRPTPASATIKGSGFYLISPTNVSPYNERVLLALTVPPSGPTPQPPIEKLWDSGWVGLNPVSVALPPTRLDIDMALNGFFCYDEVFSVQAVR